MSDEFSSIRMLQYLAREIGSKACPLCSYQELIKEVEGNLIVELAFLLDAIVYGRKDNRTRQERLNMEWMMADSLEKHILSIDEISCWACRYQEELEIAVKAFLEGIAELKFLMLHERYQLMKFEGVNQL
jgi:hypothetical protein